MMEKQRVDKFAGIFSDAYVDTDCGVISRCFVKTSAKPSDAKHIDKQ
jgi:hypothetical protein